MPSVLSTGREKVLSDAINIMDDLYQRSVDIPSNPGSAVRFKLE